MSTKIGPIQTGEEKPVAFDFTDEEVSGSIVSAVVSVSLKSGTDPSPSAVISGSASISGMRVIQKVVYQVDGAVYLLQCVATDSAGFKHTISAYLPSKAVA